MGGKGAGEGNHPVVKCGAGSEHPALIPPATKAWLRPHSHQRAVASEK